MIWPRDDVGQLYGVRDARACKVPRDAECPKREIFPRDCSNPNFTIHLYYPIHLYDYQVYRPLLQAVFIQRKGTIPDAIRNSVPAISYKCNETIA